MDPINTQTAIDHLLTFGPVYLSLLLSFVTAALLFRIGSAIRGEPTNALIYAVVILLIIDGVLNGPVKSYFGILVFAVYLLIVTGFASFILLRTIKVRLHDFLIKAGKKKQQSNQQQVNSSHNC